MLQTSIRRLVLVAATVMAFGVVSAPKQASAEQAPEVVCAIACAAAVGVCCNFAEPLCTYCIRGYGVCFDACTAL